ncbi:MAG: insulinase family protein [Ardenticatenaceae bacterium]|nr:insulinase family protein [Anaerolineales bacterium]MCB8940624.1 insulinase family protein [Ardenticatenaceae bacterium]MCB8971954.1 insulinase family protein [Ardenticatenaceae bacterium]
MTNSVHKTTLHNGLTVVLKEMHHAPVASFMVWYRVGSRQETPGNTGISHWVEHMMFKGTPTFPNGTLDSLVSREGGYWNAFTWIDFTAYYETMPSHKIDLAIQLEADRMANTLMEPEEVESERTVIISERQMYENDPNFQLMEELTSAAFRVHPYHHEVIGDLADLTTMTRTDLYGHYQRYYVPNNAIVVAVGDFSQEEMLVKIENQFGNLPSGEPSGPILRQEPEQKGERRTIVQGPGDTAYLTVAYRAPAASDPDYLPLALLNAAFAGGSSLGMFGGGGSNKSSRLYKALVNTELAASAYGGLTPTSDPFLYTINAVVQAGRSLSEVEAALDAELARLETEPINELELAKALKRAKAEFVLAGESITGQAQLLGMTEAVVGDYTWYETVLDRLSQITLDDIERVRKAYLRPSQRTVGYYEPEATRLNQ